MSEEETNDQSGQTKAPTEEEPVFKYCDSCGIRLKNPEDFGGKNPNNAWCKDCSNPDGSHKTKEEIKKNVIVNLFTKVDISKLLGETPTQEDLDKMAEDYLKRMPAWSEENNSN